MKKYCWEIDSYQNSQESWIPRVVVSIHEGDATQTIPITDENNPCASRKEADDWASKLARDYMLNNT